jgi:uncharacterized protein YukE
MSTPVQPAHSGPTELATSRADLISVRAADLAERRLAIEESVTALLTDWPGADADAFAALWSDWSSGADLVIEALTVKITSLQHANEQILAEDGRVPRPRSADDHA